MKKKKKSVCISIRLVARNNNDRAKKRLVQFSRCIGEPISYPDFKVFGIRTQFRPFDKSVMGAYPIKPTPSINGLVFKAWVFKS